MQQRRGVATVMGGDGAWARVSSGSGGGMPWPRHRGSSPRSPSPSTPRTASTEERMKEKRGDGGVDKEEETGN